MATAFGRHLATRAERGEPADLLALSAATIGFHSVGGQRLEERLGALAGEMGFRKVQALAAMQVAASENVTTHAMDLADFGLAARSAHAAASEIQLRKDVEELLRSGVPGGRLSEGGACSQERGRGKDEYKELWHAEGLSDGGWAFKGWGPVQSRTYGDSRHEKANLTWCITLGNAAQNPDLRRSI